MFSGRNIEGFQLGSTKESGFLRHCGLPVPFRVLYSSSIILLLVGSLPCRNPKCETPKNVPAIYMTCVGPPTTVFLPIICCWQTLFGKSWVMDQTTSRSCFQGSIKKNSPHPPLLNSGVRWKRYRASAVCSAVRNPRANFFLKRGFGENIDFGPFFQF